MLTGTVATAALDSSSAVIIMTLAMVNAGILTFKQSLGVVLGSNIGTTIGGQIIALDVMKYAPVLLVGGLVTYFIATADNRKQWGLVVFAAGLVFFGLEYIGSVTEPFKDYEPFFNLMRDVAANPVQGVLIGAAFTAVVQSSSATMGIVITLATNGMIPLEAGIHLMLGAEIGTCLDTVVASLGRSRKTVRTGVFHLSFNIITVVIGTLLAAQLARAGEFFAFGDDNVGRKIANVHILFNTAGVLLFLPFVSPIARFLKRTILPKDEPEPDLIAAPSKG